MKIQKRICVECKKEYTPTGNRQERCPICILLHDKKWRRTYTQLKTSKEAARQNDKIYRSTIRGYLGKLHNSINQRCHNTKQKGYKNYGGRGIQNRFKSAKEFVKYVVDELKVDPCGLQIDRIDNDGHYEPGNIRFVTHVENQRNKGRGL